MEAEVAAPEAPKTKKAEKAQKAQKAEKAEKSEKAPKAKAKAAVVTAEVVELTEAEKATLRAAVLEDKANLDKCRFSLAKRLSQVSDGALFREWGYADFYAYVTGEVGLGERSAQFLLSIHGWFGKMPDEIQQWVQEIGWSKAKELVGKVTPENFAEWRERLAGKSTRQVIEIIKGEKGEKGEKKIGKDEGEELVSIKFKLRASQAEIVEQAIEKAAKESKSDKDGYNLSLIAQAYLSAGESMTLADALVRLEKAFNVRLAAIEDNGEEMTPIFGDDLIAEIIEASGEDEDEDDNLDGN